MSNGRERLVPRSQKGTRVVGYIANDSDGGDGSGRNRLGAMLTQVRAELREQL